MRFIPWTAASLPALWLAGCPGLDTLALEHVPLGALPAGWFTALPALRTLSLVNTSLAALEPATWDPVAVTLETIDLRYNSLSALPAELFNVTFPVLQSWCVCAWSSCLNLRPYQTLVFASDLSNNALTALPEDLYFNAPAILLAYGAIVLTCPSVGC